MKQAFFLLTLLDDVVLSETAATAGGHRTIDFISGGNLLGASAARLYESLTVDDSFTVYHSGQVRFGHGLPLSDRGMVAFPMPLSWHEEKYSEAQTVGEDNILRHQSIRLGSTSGCRQLRNGYVTLAGEWVKPSRSLGMKTAIDADLGRAQEGHLFGYQAIRAGARFIASLDADDAVSGVLFQRVSDSLTGRTLRLGRSRSAQYGRVDCERLPGSQPLFPTQTNVIGCRQVTFWLLSDLAVNDPWGVPTQRPQPSWLGLPSGRLLMERSYLRARSYAPYNTKRRHHDLERPCLHQGSVLCFELDEPLESHHQSRLEFGLGLYREGGLGRVWANPPLLEKVVFDPNAVGLVSTLSSTPVTPERDYPFIQWLKHRVDSSGKHAEDALLAETVQKTLKDLYRNARQLHGLSPTTPVGPGPSQWSGVMALAKRAKTRAALFSELFGTGQTPTGLCSEKGGNQGWGDETSLNGKLLSFRQWFKEACSNNEVHELCCFVTELARRGADVAKEENRS